MWSAQIIDTERAHPFLLCRFEKLPLMVEHAPLRCRLAGQAKVIAAPIAYATRQECAFTREVHCSIRLKEKRRPGM